MTDRTGIEWTDSTWNPVTGCTEVSAGCSRCYAKTLAERFRGTPGHYFEDGFDVVLRPVSRVGKKAAGRSLDGRTWDEYAAKTGSDGGC